MRKLLTLTAIILLLSVFFSGCGFGAWQEEEGIRSIQEIKRVTDEDGNVYLEITYQDNSPSDRFLIPKGTSITNVTTNYDSENRVTNVTMSFSEGTDFTFEIPDGADGASVNRVEITEKNGLRYLSFKYVDALGNELNSWDINIDEFKGQDGSTWLMGEGAPDKDPENPVEAKTGDFYLDTQSYTVYTKLSNGYWKNMGSIKGTGIVEILPFSDEKGQGYEIVTSETLLDGEGQPVLDESGKEQKVSYKVYSSALTSMNVSYNATTGMYEFVVTVTDVLGNQITFGDGDSKIQVQRPATWLSGVLPPDLNDLPEFRQTPTFDGDFYYCTQYNQIFQKTNGSWKLLIDLSTSLTENKVSVTFMPEGGTLSTNVNDYPADHTVNQDGSVTVRLEKGSTYPQASVIPTPQREGYVFLGWYKTKNVEFVNGAPINNGAFTDMVPVTENITLYAIWAKATTA